MTPEVAVNMTHPSAIGVAAMNSYVSKSKDYPFSGNDRAALVMLPLIKEMNKASDIEQDELSYQLHVKTTGFHSEFHQFEGPHAELTFKKIGECLNFPGESFDVAQMIVGFIQDAATSEQDFVELYTSAVAFSISKNVHTNMQSPYILTSVAL